MEAGKGNQVPAQVRERGLNSGIMIKKMLIANRGEIAQRVMRTAREMGISTVAVYSDADRGMPFVRLADEAVCIGEAPSSASYLRAERILEVARDRGADALHPGYGFLSENAEFAQAVADAGLVFIGPSAQSISMMGNKISAKQAARKFGVPMVPGSDQPLASREEAEAIAAETGYPLIIKAAAGGGGKGMRVVHDPGELGAQLDMARREALNAFGNGDLFIERYVGSPRHIEIQVLGDQHGNYVHLFERECSIQRRHQKLVEEAPSSFLRPEVRKAMGESAINVARACQYYGAGTVEFLVDEHQAFYFLEMNTRLQVEHGITEWITGVDLVAEQIRIAEGKPLSCQQEELKIQGHAIELRVCAENPREQFLPDTGQLKVYDPPRGPGVRVDDGYAQGAEVSIHYDSMIAKLMVHAPDRPQAIARMRRAIEEYKVLGVETTLGFGRWVMDHPAFQSGDIDTHFIENYFRPEVLDEGKEDRRKWVALLAAWFWNQDTARSVKSAALKEAGEEGGDPAWIRRRRY